MARVLKGTPESMLSTPDGIVTMKINTDTGLRDEHNGVNEYFYAEFLPRGRDDGLAPGGQPARDIRDQLF